LDRRYDLIMASVFVAVGVGVLVYALNYPEPKVHFDDIGPMGFPVVLGISFVIGGVWQGLSDLEVLKTIGRFGIDEGKADDEEDLPASFLKALSIMIGSGAYLLGIQLLGYLIATPIAVAAGLRVMDTPVRRMVLVALFFTAWGYLTFDTFLGVSLPSGSIIHALAKSART